MADVPDYRDDLDLAIRLAREAGRAAAERAGHVERQTKTHETTTDEAVTVADREAQRLIVSGLRDVRGGDGIIGEESETGESITATGLQPEGRNWVIDPIDGTNNFIAGLGNWAVCVGLLDEGRPVVGVVYDVARDVLHAGCEGGGATLNGEPCHAIGEPWSSASILMLSSNLIDERGRAPQWACRLLDQTHWKVRMLGSAALEASAVGAGIAQGAVTINGKLWDCVAPAAFTLAAGGVVARPDGGALFPYDVTGYAGAKVPFVATGSRSLEGLVAKLRA